MHKIYLKFPSVIPAVDGMVTKRYLGHISGRYNLQLGVFKILDEFSVLEKWCLCHAPWQWSPTPGCQCCGSPAGFLPSELGALLGQSDSFPLFLLGLRKMSPVRYPFSCLFFPSLFILFSLLCLLWSVPMEVKPLGLTALLQWLLPSYSESFFRARGGFLTALWPKPQ